MKIVNECKYVFMDIVGYSKNRSVEAQVDIITELNLLVKKALSDEKIPSANKILIPTGDGICIALIGNNFAFDVHLSVALKILLELSSYNKVQKDQMRRFEVRIGINENIDNIVNDINGRRNVAGSGINYAQRVMSFADESMILLGNAVYEKLSKREKYIGSFNKYSAIIKHNERLIIYQYTNISFDFLNNECPSAFKKEEEVKEKISINTHIAFYMAIIERDKDEIKNGMEDYLDTYYVKILLYYLTKDLLSIFYTESGIIKRPILNIGEALNIEDYSINYKKGITFLKEHILTYIIHEIGGFYTQELLGSSNVEMLFESGSRELLLSNEGKEKLVNEYMNIVSFINGKK
jgi:hypothetical protein